MRTRIRDADPALVAALSAHVGRLARSTADQCRELEDLPLPDLQPSAKLHASAGLVETLSTGERQLE